jgi:hypothetical protein
MTEPPAWPLPDAAVYRIRVRGHLASHWAAWFAGLTLTQHPDGTTTLEGPVRDQAALYGLISRARDLGLTLLIVQRVEGGG